MNRANVVTKNEKEHVVLLGGHELGIAKVRSDADLHANLINDAIDTAFEEGKDSFNKALELVAEKMYASQPTSSSHKVVGGGRCKKCDGPTTYTRQNSPSGLCFACENGLK